MKMPCIDCIVLPICIQMLISDLVFTSIYLKCSSVREYISKGEFIDTIALDEVYNYLAKKRGDINE